MIARDEWPKLLAEFIGTYGLVFAGCGAIVIDEVSGGAVTHSGIALTFGLVVMVVIYAVGPTSGAHLNPAVTVAFALAKRFAWARVPAYVVTQFVAALAAAFTLRVLFPEVESLGVTRPAGSATQSFVLELLLTLGLMFVILHVATGSKEQGLMAGIAIGGTVGLEAMFAGPICGASMNPARSLGPAVALGMLEHLWLYLVATTLGAAIAVPLWLGSRPLEHGTPNPDVDPESSEKEA
ncbi:MAG: aquaporin [Planctomycetota bacterium]